jgi:hypothetical protein
VPRFDFFLETADQPVTPGHAVWSLPLPSSRNWNPEDPSGHPSNTLSVGDYFSAIRLFLEGPSRNVIDEILAENGAGVHAPESFHIYLAKHGEFYHPARLKAFIGGRKRLEGVVNVAFSPAGTRLIRKEYALLKKLVRQVQPAYLPEVHAFAEMPVPGRPPLPMFLGEWFSGFQEFHLTRNTPNGKQQLVLWDSENGNRYLAREQSEELYRQATRILTHYFNLSTLECIGAWHHAAGDFVVRLSGSGMDVRLVSVREYSPLLRRGHAASHAAPDIRTLLEVLLLFLLKTSLHMRLDRLDGVGQVGWSGPEAVGGTLAGFVEAVADKPAPAEMPLGKLFLDYLASISEADLLDLCRGIVAKTFHPLAPELSLVKSRLSEHAADLAEAISRRG